MLVERANACGGGFAENTLHGEIGRNSQNGTGRASLFT
jgi:hypothetical protein